MSTYDQERTSYQEYFWIWHSDNLSVSLELKWPVSILRIKKTFLDKKYLHERDQVTNEWKNV